MRRLAAGMVTVLVGAVGFVTLSHQALSVHRDPWLSWDNAAQRQAMARAIKAGDGEAARAHALLALRAMPLDQLALATSSHARDAEGQARILNLSAALGWRDPATNLALIRAAMREGAHDIAAQRIDAFGRTAGAEAITDLADQLILQPSGRAALLRRAEARNDGQWWQDYLRTLPANRNVAEARADLVAAFDKGDGAWLRRIAGDAGIGLSGSGHSDLAIRLTHGLGGAAPTSDNAIYDSSFASFRASGGGLTGEWTQPVNAPALIDSTGGGGITVEPVSRSAGRVLVQRLVLSPGLRTLTVTGESEGSAGLHWTLGCVGGGIVPLGGTNATSGAIGSWSVPVPAECSLAELALVKRRDNQSGKGVTRVRSVRLSR